MMTTDAEPQSPPRRIARLAIGGLVVTGALAFGAYQLHVLAGRETTDDAFIEGSMVFLAARVPGEVIEVAIAEHQRVQKGELLVRLDPAEYEIEVARTQAAVANAENQMQAKEAAAASAEAEGKAAESELWRAARETERLETLFTRKATSRQELDQAIAARDAAKARMRAAQLRAKAERAVLGNRAPVHQAEAQLHKAELALAHTCIDAPFDGVIGRKNVEPGAIVAPGQPLLSLTSNETPWVMANFKETQIRKMKLGSRVDIHIDAYPGMLWRGHIASFSPATGSKFALLPPEPASGNFTKVVQRVPVKIVLDEGPGISKSSTDNEVPAPRLLLGLAAKVTVFVR